MARSLLKVPVHKFAIAHGLLKLVAIVTGLVLSQVCLMASLGLLTGSGWIRFLVGLAANLLIPLAFADRLLPKDDPSKSKGLASDALSLIWLGFPFLFAVVGHGLTGPALAREAGRLDAVGLQHTALLARTLAGGDTAPGATPATATSRPGGSSAPGASPAASPHASLSLPASPSPNASSNASASASASASPGSSAEPPASAAPTGTRGGPHAPPKDRTPAELFKQLAPSVVTISFSAPGGIRGGGTGFLIDDEGTIATNHHVIAPAKQLEIKFVNGALFKSVELLAQDADRDLALLRVKLDQPEKGTPKVDAPPLTLGDSDGVVVGEHAIAIGNPLGLDHTLTDGLVSARRMYQGKAWIQMSVPVSPGNSGGPLFNMQGEVIGVITAQILGGYGGRAQNLNLAVPIDALAKMIQSKYPNRRPFGSPGASTQW